jgi:hypothetical protein
MVFSSSDEHMTTEICRISKVAACRMQLQAACYGTEDAAAVQYLSRTMGENSTVNCKSTDCKLENTVKCQLSRDNYGRSSLVRRLVAR